MARNIVLDFGAVLFDWRPEVLVQACFPAQAATPTAARELAAAIFHHEQWLDFDRGMTLLPAVIEQTAHRLGLPVPSVAALMSGIPLQLAPIQETLAVLGRLVRRREQLNDIRLYYLSNMPAPFARVLEQRHPFLAWFDGGVFSGDVNWIKPQTEIFQALEARYRLEPDETVFVDDHLKNVQAANTRGWWGIHFESAELLEQRLATWLNRSAQ